MPGDPQDNARRDDALRHGRTRRLQRPDRLEGADAAVEEMHRHVRASPPSTDLMHCSWKVPTDIEDGTLQSFVFSWGLNKDVRRMSPLRILIRAVGVQLVRADSASATTDSRRCFQLLVTGGAALGASGGNSTSSTDTPSPAPKPKPKGDVGGSSLPPLATSSPPPSRPSPLSAIPKPRPTGVAPPVYLPYGAASASFCVSWCLGTVVSGLVAALA